MTGKTHTELAEFAVSIGESVAKAASRLRRTTETNQKWENKVGFLLDQKIRRLLENSARKNNYQIYAVSMPYVAETIEMGKGKDHLNIRIIGNGKKKVACLYDVIDGTWNETAGLKFSVSTILAFTKEISGKLPGKFSINDFTVGVVAPHHGEGLYYAIKGLRPVFRNYKTGKEESLRLTSETDTNKLRCIIDVFTSPNKKVHDKAIDSIIPIMKEWRDFGRYYGTGIELMSLLGRLNAEPAYGGYVTFNQKTDNLVAPLLILSCAGAIISDWNGNPITNKLLEEKANVVVASNKALYNLLISHVKGKM